MQAPAEQAVAGQNINQALQKIGLVAWHVDNRLLNSAISTSLGCSRRNAGIRLESVSQYQCITYNRPTLEK
jgi:hypothetical protein